jgi:pimeloyl-ACP methyl ester carboxylesterase
MKTNTALERHFANTPSARISYLQAGGEGSVALFVHGVIVNGYLWRHRHQLAALSDLRRCIAVDLMGHGHTVIAPEQPVSFEAQAEMLAQFLDTLGLDQVDLVANNSGTGIAQIFATRYPERLRTLTLTNGDVQDNWPPKDFSGFLDMVKAGGLPETLQRMLDDKPSSDREMQWVVPMKHPKPSPMTPSRPVHTWPRRSAPMTWCASSSLSTTRRLYALNTSCER